MCARVTAVRHLPVEKRPLAQQTGAHERPLCFVIGPIGVAGTPTRKLADWLLKGIVRPTLEQLDYRVKRADDDADPGSITAALINDIVDADLVVADLTGFNPNAFYELGIRHALQKPTIHMIAEDASLPFDNKDQRTIFVDVTDIDSIEGAKIRLREAALATQEAGYKTSNPVTQAIGLADLARSGDTASQIIAQLQGRLANLEATIRHAAPSIVGQGPLATMSLEEARTLLLMKDAESKISSSLLAQLRKSGAWDVNTVKWLLEPDASKAELSPISRLLEEQLANAGIKPSPAEQKDE